MKKIVFWTLLLIHGLTLRAMNQQSLATTTSTAIITHISALLNHVRLLLSLAPAPSSDQHSVIIEDLDIWEDMNTDPDVIAFFQEKTDMEWQDLYQDRSTIKFLITHFNDKHKKLIAHRIAWIQTAESTLAKVKQSLPANRRSYISTNLGGLEAQKIQDVLEAARIRYSSYLERAATHFAEDFEIQTIRENLKKCGWNHEHDYQRIYPSLGYSNTDALKLPYEKIIHRLAQKNQEAQAEPDQLAIKCFRQIEYIVGDPFRHEAFNAYVRGGRAAVQKLRIDASLLDQLVVRDALAEARAEINDVDKQLKMVTEYSSKLHIHLLTLPKD